MPATDDNRTIRLTTPLGKDVLLFAGFSGSERLSQPFKVELDVLSEKGDIEAEHLLGKPVVVKCALPSGSGERVFHGLASDFTQLSYGKLHHEYRMTLRPWFWFLSHTADCRVFQGMTVKDIFTQLVKDKGFSDFRFDLKGTYVKHAYCVQYRETAFNFLSRLLEQEGIYYFFEHTESKHTMVLVDDSASHTTVSDYDKVPYYPPTTTNALRERDHLQSWTYVKACQPGAYATTDYDYRTPKTSLLKSQVFKRPNALASAEIFDYPAELPVKDVKESALDASDASRLVKVRLDELQAAYAVARGHGNALGVKAGSQFELTDHPRADFNKKYLVVATGLSLTSNAHESGDEDDTDYHIEVEAIDLTTQFRPPRVTPKPVIQGAQTATVVGKKGEEIDVDDAGCVKVQFYWDRQGKDDEKSSCRVRVAQVWAGQGWGAMHVPRIGQEVIVSFLEGDPDRPIITGRVYNEVQKPPYTLPANATQSGIKTRSTKDGNDKTFNEIRFEDKKGSEELLVHAEKDLKVNVENDGTWMIGLTDQDKLDKKQKGKATIGVGKIVDVDVGETIKVVAGDEITLETGESKIVMKKDGEITITCKNLIVKTTQLIDLKSQQNIKGEAMMKLELEGKQQFSAKSLQVAIEGTTKAEFKSSVSTKVEGTMLDLNANGIATLKGALTKIG